MAPTAPVFSSTEPLDAFERKVVIYEKDFRLARKTTNAAAKSRGVLAECGALPAVPRPEKVGKMTKPERRAEHLKRRVEQVERMFVELDGVRATVDAAGPGKASTQHPASGPSRRIQRLNRKAKLAQSVPMPLAHGASLVQPVPKPTPTFVESFAGLDDATFEAELLIRAAPEPPQAGPPTADLPPKPSSALEAPHASSSIASVLPARPVPAAPVARVDAPAVMAVAPREEPSTTYIDRAYEPSYFVDEADRPPLLVVLDLNQTLLVRDGRSQSESATPTARPFLSTFMRYLGSRTTSGHRRFEPIIWSSSQPQSVDLMCLALGVRSRTPDDSLDDPSALLAIWARDTMGLSAHDYRNKARTVKDLERLWSALRIPQTRPPLRFSCADTVLIDDSADKARLQPYNHLLVPSFAKQDAPTDRALLNLIGRLHRLRATSNVAQAVLRGDDDPAYADEAEAIAHRVCAQLAIPVEHHFTFDWPRQRYVG